MFAGVLVAGRADGILEAWDLLDRTQEPVLVVTVATVALTSLSFSPAMPKSAAKSRSQQQLLAVGEVSGVHDLVCYMVTTALQLLNPRVALTE
jgi:hypothetical protein